MPAGCSIGIVVAKVLRNLNSRHRWIIVNFEESLQADASYIEVIAEPNYWTEGRTRMDAQK